ncbi:MAG TPA: tyrosine-type recombinase/integrase [Pleomorphomonadaceae bacterium]|nr:tyrosine-type recombinase/integrase [Pleomorphomonadaceae bacterium]
MTRTTGGMVRHHPARDLWEARYLGADGRRHSLYAPTRKAAQERLRVALAAADQGIRPIGNRLTVSAFLDEWLAGIRRSRRARTAESYATIARLYVIPAIGHLPLAKLEPEHVSRMLTRLTDRGTLSPTTIRAAYAVLRTALSAALREGKVVRNVATLVDPPKRERVERRPLTRKQVRVLLDGVRGDSLEALYVTALGTGLRQGELLALRWPDVDLDRGELTVRYSLGRFTRELEPTKTDRSRRTLRLPRSAVAALAAHRARPVMPLTELVFCTRQGKPLASTNVTRRLQQHLTRLGLPHQRFHDLRHAFATLMLEDGEDLAVVSRSLGHTTIATTADVYAHITPAMLDRAADRMESILTG